MSGGGICIYDITSVRGSVFPNKFALLAQSVRAYDC